MMQILLAWLLFLSPHCNAALVRNRQGGKAFKQNHSQAISDSANQTDVSPGTSRRLSSRVRKQAVFPEAVIVTLHRLDSNVKRFLIQLNSNLQGSHRDLYALVDSNAIPNCPAELESVSKMLGGPDRVICTSYDAVQKEVFPKPTAFQERIFGTFQGIYRSPAKPGALWWLAEGPGAKYTFAWVIESDVRLNGDWSTIFDTYDTLSGSPDLVALLDKPYSWPHWVKCTHPGCMKKAERMRSFLAIFRVSRHLAADVIETLRAGTEGHHEALLHTICKEERRWKCKMADLAQSGFVGSLVPSSGELPDGRSKGKLYHPVK
eukprot:gnl/MRDRNA2_/MRDRNA2_28486_c0_seq1.p1 gnl/MRDRNA2_/MRDRNA2_28486_c0~~gnl/MRDRNA2_/MRDRNA2_28486_c0_seq1.p1  ORF type:complete len:319 (+),score=36.53 gnl/MRDRNA2_/MRDRNA2_28486_c0_seq1:93-1049(+)